MTQPVNQSQAMVDEDGNRVVAIDYRDNKPFVVWTIAGEELKGFDFEWCKAHQTLYYEEGGGGGGAVIVLHPFSNPETRQKIWVWPEVKLRIERDDDVVIHDPTDEDLLSCGYVRIAEPVDGKNPFEGALPCDGIIACYVCKDMFPWGSECRHLVWIESWGMYGGCGAHESDHKEHFPSLRALLRVMGAEFARVLRDALATSNYEFNNWGDVRLSNRDFGDLLELVTASEPDKFFPGLCWLSSLEPGVTTDAEKTAVKWTDEYLAAAETQRTQSEGTEEHTTESVKSVDEDL